jgi:hypothetical protein
MGGEGASYRVIKASSKEYKEEYGIPCPGCVKDHPKRSPTIMTPGKRCKVCGFQDRRRRMTLIELTGE